MIYTSSLKPVHLLLLVAAFSSLATFAVGCSEEDKGSDEEESEVMGAPGQATYTPNPAVVPASAPQASRPAMAQSQSPMPPFFPSNGTIYPSQTYTGRAGQSGTPPMHTFPRMP